MSEKKQPPRRLRADEAPPQVMTVPEVAAYLGMTRQKVYELLDAGAFESSGRSGKGHTIRVWGPSVVSWVRGQRRPAKAS